MGQPRGHGWGNQQTGLRGAAPQEDRRRSGGRLERTQGHGSAAPFLPARPCGRPSGAARPRCAALAGSRPKESAPGRIRRAAASKHVCAHCSRRSAGGGGCGARGGSASRGSPTGGQQGRARGGGGSATHGRAQHLWSSLGEPRRAQRGTGWSQGSRRGRARAACLDDVGGAAGHGCGGVSGHNYRVRRLGNVAVDVAANVAAGRRRGRGAEGRRRAVVGQKEPT